MRAWLLTLFVLLHAAVASPQGVTVRGRVVADDTGAPIAGARVAISGLPVHVRTDADGRFEFPLPAAVAPVAVDHPGYARAVLPRAATTNDVNVRLVRAAALTVQIINQQGEPVPGTTVRITCGNGTSVGVSNDLGQRRDGHLQPGPCSVNVGNVGAWVRIMGEPTLEQIATAFTQLQANADAATAAAKAEAIAVDLRAGEESSIVALDRVAPPQSTITILGEARRLNAGSGSVRGRIIGPGRRPIEGARVTLSNSDGGLTTLSNASGNYAFDNVPGGRFRVRGARPGLVTREYGQPTPGAQGRDVDVREGAQLSGIDIALTTRGNAITGVVSGDSGEPLEGVGIQLFRFDNAVGRTRSLSSLPAVTSTDDRGRFRLSTQAPGKYYVGAALLGGRYAAGPVYFPNRPDIGGATPVQVESGFDVENVDIRFSPSIGALVQGTVVDADGQPVQDGQVLLSGSDRARDPVLPRTSEIDHGRFAFLNLPAGNYILSLRPQDSSFVTLTVRNGQIVRPPAPPTRVGRAVVVVGDAPPPPVVIVTSEGSTLSGRIELEGVADRVTPANFQLAAYPADGTGGTPGGAIADIASDWTFRMPGVGEPSWFWFTGPPGWWLKSLTLGGVESADRVVAFGEPGQSRDDVVAVFARTAGEVGGTVSEGGKSVANYLVVAFPLDEASWVPQSRFVKVGRPNQSGEYAISLPPGEYWLAAVDAAGVLGKQMLGTLVPFAEHIVVRDRERVQTNLRLNRLPR
jgi:hypothetical protein